MFNMFATQFSGARSVPFSLTLSLSIVINFVATATAAVVVVVIYAVVALYQTCAVCFLLITSTKFHWNEEKKWTTTTRYNSILRPNIILRTPIFDVRSTHMNIGIWCLVVHLVVKSCPLIWSFENQCLA